MLSMTERQERSGLFVVGSKRYMKSNNNYLADYNCNEVAKHLMYWDMNNLYACAMSRHLPCKHLRRVTSTTLNKSSRLLMIQCKFIVLKVDV